MASVGRLFDLPRSATFRAGTKLILFAEPNRMHAIGLTSPVTFRTIAFDFLLVRHVQLLVDLSHLPNLAGNVSLLTGAVFCLDR